jgi:hypothetical protein
MTMARLDAPTEVITEFMKRLRNSSRTVEVWKIESGDRPSERQPFQSGWKSTKGMRWPCVTSTAV